MYKITIHRNCPDCGDLQVRERGTMVCIIPCSCPKPPGPPDPPKEFKCSEVEIVESPATARLALKWYQSEVSALAKAYKEENGIVLRAVMQVLVLDAGDRASGVLEQNKKE